MDKITTNLADSKFAIDAIICDMGDRVLRITKDWRTPYIHKVDGAYGVYGVYGVYAADDVENYWDAGEWKIVPAYEHADHDAWIPTVAEMLS